MFEFGELVEAVTVQAYVATGFASVGIALMVNELGVGEGIVLAVVQGWVLPESQNRKF